MFRAEAARVKKNERTGIFFPHYLFSPHRIFFRT